MWRRRLSLENPKVWRAATGFAGVGISPGVREGLAMVDMNWVTPNIAVGGGIWHDQNMIEVVRAGITHIIDMQIEFDDTSLAEPYGVVTLWNPVDDDFQPKSSAVLRRGVSFANHALKDPSARLLIHCAAGIHRAPMMTLAVLCARGWEIEEAMTTIRRSRSVVDWADVYVTSVRDFVSTYVPSED